MPKLSFERHVPFAPDSMLELVADLKTYPQFVPNCSSMDVERDRGQPGDVRMARMKIKFGPIKQSYTSRVDINRDNKTVRARAIDGPFSHLDSVWSFVADDEGTCVRFNIDFAISNPFIAAAAEPAFAHKQEEIVDAFMDEARRRYS